MGCKNTKSVSKPIVFNHQKSLLLTPVVMRRNLKHEILRNNGKIRKLREEIVRSQADHYVVRSENPENPKLLEIEESISKVRTKIFHLETHNMILELHLDTAAPGQYPNQHKMKRFRSRNNAGLSKASTLTSSKLNGGYLTTESSYNYIQTKPSGTTEGEWLYRTSLHSIADEGDQNISF